MTVFQNAGVLIQKFVDYWRKSIVFFSIKGVCHMESFVVVVSDGVHVAIAGISLRHLKFKYLVIVLSWCLLVELFSSQSCYIVKFRQKRSMIKCESLAFLVPTADIFEAVSVAV